eukprot:g43152.t1
MAKSLQTREHLGASLLHSPCYNHILPLVENRTADSSSSDSCGLRCRPVSSYWSSSSATANHQREDVERWSMRISGDAMRPRAVVLRIAAIEGAVATAMACLRGPRLMATILNGDRLYELRIFSSISILGEMSQLQHVGLLDAGLVQRRCVCDNYLRFSSFGHITCFCTILILISVGMRVRLQSDKLSDRDTM